jgi:hypothetical protein
LPLDLQAHYGQVVVLLEAPGEYGVGLRLVHLSFRDQEEYLETLAADLIVDDAELRLLLLRRPYHQE